MSSNLEIYPYRVCTGEEEDEFGHYYYVEIQDVDGYKCKLKFNDSNDCRQIDRLISGLLSVSSHLCAKAEWEETICDRCPEN